MKEVLKKASDAKERVERLYRSVDSGSYIKTDLKSVLGLLGDICQTEVSEFSVLVSYNVSAIFTSTDALCIVSHLKSNTNVTFVRNVYIFLTSDYSFVKEKAFC
jgi:hypothetical protein